MDNNKLDITNKLILAPMADVTDTPFRKIARKQGAYLTFTQMVSAKGILNSNFDSLRYLAFSKNEKPIGVQLLGSEPSIVGEAVSEVLKYSPSWIDLNSGCSVEKVTKQQLGSSLMDKPELLGKLVREMKNNAKDVPVSIKLRIGSDHSNYNVIRNAKIAEENGADAVIVHGRTRIDPYEAEPQNEWIGKVKEAVSIKVVGNGSIFTAEEADELTNNTGCDAVLIARGALGNPFIFKNYNKMLNGEKYSGHPPVEEMYPIFKEHVELILREYGPVQSVSRIKKQIFWYFRFYGGIDILINEILSLSSNDQILQIVENHFNKIKNGQVPKYDPEDIRRRFNKRVVFWVNEFVPNIYQYMY